MFVFLLFLDGGGLIPQGIMRKKKKELTLQIIVYGSWYNENLSAIKVSNHQFDFYRERTLKSVFGFVFS